MSAASATPTELRKRATWIRDVLDPIIARDGPDTMHPNDVLVLHELFTKLQRCESTRWTLRFSRIHYAVSEVAGKATRWPSRLADECDKLVRRWENQYGPLRELRPVLYHLGGRLYGVSTPQDLTRESLLRRWTAEKTLDDLNERAMQHGDLGFEPGQWWINGMFAFHAGIIDAGSTDGGICANNEKAVAIVLNGSDEIGTSAANFTYRCQPNDRGRYRLTSAEWRARCPIRVLRSHSQASLWAPRAGIRYEGLYRVTGWTIKPANPKDHEGAFLLYEIKLKREPDQRPMDDVARHPLAEEIDDYKEYKRLRRAQRDMLRQLAMGKLRPGHSRTTKNTHAVGPEAVEATASWLDNVHPMPLRRETHQSTYHLPRILDGSSDSIEHRSAARYVSKPTARSPETPQSLFRPIDWNKSARTNSASPPAPDWQPQKTEAVREIPTSQGARGAFASKSEQGATAGNARSFLRALEAVHEDLEEPAYPDKVTDVDLSANTLDGAASPSPPIAPVEEAHTHPDLSRVLFNARTRVQEMHWQSVDCPADGVGSWLEYAVETEEQEQPPEMTEDEILDCITLFSSMALGGQMRGVERRSRSKEERIGLSVRE